MSNKFVTNETETPKASVQRKPWSAPLVIVSTVKLETSKSTTSDPIDFTISATKHYS